MLSEPFFKQLERSLTREGLTPSEAMLVASLVRDAIADQSLAEFAGGRSPAEGGLGDLIENLRVDFIHVVEQVREELRSEMARMASRQKSILVYTMLILWIIIGLIAAIVTLDGRTPLRETAPRLQHPEQTAGERRA